MSIITIIAALLGLSFLILVHEMGHFWVARFFKIPIVNFSIGFGPVLLKWRDKRGTQYTLRAILLGGYVKFLENDDPKNNLKGYDNHSPWIRSAVVLAGPISNLLLAYVFYLMLGTIGVNGINPVVGEVKVPSLAADAEFTTGDKIVKINNKNIHTWQDFLWATIPLIGNKDIKVQLQSQDGPIIDSSLNLQSVDIGELEKTNIEEIIGVSPKLPKVLPIIALISEDSAAAESSLQVADEVLAVNGDSIQSWEEFSQAIRASAEKPMELAVLRNEQRVSVTLTPRAKSAESGETIGFAGIAPQGITLTEEYLITASYSFSEIWGYAAHKTYLALKITFVSLYHLFAGNLSVSNLSGPVSIVKYVGDSISTSFQSFVQLLSYISLSLFIFNLLPLPVLDGGHLVLYLMEIVRGKKATPKFINIYYRIGFVILISLFIFVTTNDIIRLL